MLEAVFKASTVVEVRFFLVSGVNIFSAYLPEEGMEAIFIPVFFKVVEQFDFLAVSLKVGPYIPVDRNNDFAAKILRHTEHIYGSHFILHSNRIFTEGSKGDINIKIFAVFCKVNGEVRVS